VICVHAPAEHAQSVFVVLAYATAPPISVVHGIGIQLSTMHEYKAGGDDVTIPVSPASADVHVGSPDTVLLWIATLYTLLFGRPVAAFCDGSELHPAPTVPKTPHSAATDTTSCLLIAQNLSLVVEHLPPIGSRDQGAVQMEPETKGRLL
jgi:hypothetical protein